MSYIPNLASYLIISADEISYSLNLDSCLYISILKSGSVRVFSTSRIVQSLLAINLQIYPKRPPDISYQISLILRVDAATDLNGTDHFELSTLLWRTDPENVMGFHAGMDSVRGWIFLGNSSLKSLGRASSFAS